MLETISFNKQQDEYFFVDFVHILQNTLIDALSDHLKKLPISYAQSRLLLQLSKQEGINQKNLSRSVDIEPATMVRTLDRMERDGLVQRQRSDVDRREIKIFLTDKGKALYPLILSAYNILENEIKGITGKTNLKNMICQVHRIFSNDLSNPKETKSQALHITPSFLMK